MPHKNPDLAPIEFELTVAVDPDHAFDLFANRFGKWWPTESHSLSKGDCISVDLHPGLGGEIVERAKGKENVTWGQVEIWQPGEHLAFTWHPGWNAGDYTRVSVSFDQNAFGHCIIRLVHKDWENVGDIAPVLRAGYLAGWEYAFGECFANYLNARRG
ncbi:SRPBCC domain-containing protein [Thalassospira sp. MA62]|nr:SRPBCC domain-containing protein [Thalassospira sp. MA62]